MSEPPPPSRIPTLLRARQADLTPAEARVAEALLADHPTAGLGTVAALARRAGVSDPTVVRLVAKLGFDGFAEFQRALLDEVEERLRSPLMMLDSRAPAAEGSAEAYLASLEVALTETRQRELAPSYDRAAALLADRRLRISLLGGRFSRFLAGILQEHLVQLRPGTRHLQGTAAELVDALVDLGRQDVLVVFDYRRYQADVVDFARQAQARGARLLLFTDPWRSPLAEIATLVFTAPVAAGSAYDTMVPALAQVEALLACLLQARSPETERRLRALEELRAGNRVTLD
ncbi:MurR/RpiR family transcriptional regulator [Roseomonas sp. 18066]|uniref:MurR/RpiR family transcriptional regulator n=1 Tax=Roseomonas sp. 18066 TaxID=2681412 RepID=UPI001358BA05|nr:MurR/RpiR family transcriptional regulator [Roseomonas sp. 18066]